MSPDLTPDGITALAPDAKVAAAGKKLGAPKSWQNLGHSPEALWGECKGSAIYQVRADLSDLALKCSCPSRKQPCKHAVGLLFLALDTPLPEQPPPDWVTDWLSRRRTAAEKREKKSAGEGKSVDPKARARREERVSEGLDALEVWMEDLIRTGLATAGTKPYAFWEQQASRMVDAQAPGIAAHLRRMAEVPNSAPDWPKKLLADLGQLALLTRAFRRLEELSPPLQEDVRRGVGWTLTEEEVLSRGETVSDAWTVLGSRTEHEGRLTVRRTWLLGTRTRRPALVLSYTAPGGKPSGKASGALVPGRRFEAELAFWPSAYPIRALVRTRFDGGKLVPDLPGHESLDAFLESAAEAVARQPWLELLPCALSGVKVLRDADARWWVRDHEGRALPLEGDDHWWLLALSGGLPLDVACEWDGERLSPLGAICPGSPEGARWTRS